MPPDQEHKRVLVAGATGRLGVIVQTLQERGQSVRAMTRDPNSQAAGRLRGAGVDVIYGDFDDPDSIVRAAAGTDAVFATGTAHKAGPEGELRHGHNLAGAVAEAGVPHLVYSSADGAAADSPVPLFRAKDEVEQHIRSLPIAHTILAPVYFMENLFNPWNVPALHTGTFPSPIPIDSPLQQVAIEDLVMVAALAIERPDEFAGRRITIASDVVTAEQAAAELGRLIGREFEPEQIQREQLAPGLRALFAWLEQTGHNADLPTLQHHYPEVHWHSYQTWLHSQWSRLRGLCPREHAGVS